jgi:hypothetical protein
MRCGGAAACLHNAWALWPVRHEPGLYLLVADAAERQAGTQSTMRNRMAMKMAAHTHRMDTQMETRLRALDDACHEVRSSCSVSHQCG